MPCFPRLLSKLCLSRLCIAARLPTATPQQHNPANVAAHACTRLMPACLPRTAHGGARCRQDLWAAGGFEALLALLKEEAHQVAVLDALAAWLEQVGYWPNLFPDRP